MRLRVIAALSGAVILASNLFVSPILNVAYLSSLAIIGGARSVAQVQAFIKLAFGKLMRLSWISSPIAMAFAQRFVSPDLCACCGALSSLIDRGPVLCGHLLRSRHVRPVWAQWSDAEMPSYFNVQACVHGSSLH